MVQKKNRNHNGQKREKSNRNKVYSTYTYIVIRQNNDELSSFRLMEWLPGRANELRVIKIRFFDNIFFFLIRTNFTQHFLTHV